MKFRGRVSGLRGWGVDHPRDGRGLGRINETNKQNHAGDDCYVNRAGDFLWSLVSGPRR